MNDPKIIQPQDVVFGAVEARADPVQEALSGLQAVPQEALEKFCSHVGMLYSIPESRGAFFAYFTQPIVTVKNQKMVFKPITRMTYADLLESLRVVCRPLLEQQGFLENIVQDRPADKENVIEVCTDMLPEYAYFAERSEIRYTTQYSSPYAHLMYLPARGKTFYAGLLTDAGVPPLSVKERPKKHVVLPVSTTQVLNYAKKIGIEDVLPYLKMLQVHE